VPEDALITVPLPCMLLAIIVKDVKMSVATQWSRCWGQLDKDDGSNCPGTGHAAG